MWENSLSNAQEKKKIRERERNKEVETKSHRVGLMRAAAQTGAESERPVRAARRSDLIWARNHRRRTHRNLCSACWTACDILTMQSQFSFVTPNVMHFFRYMLRVCIFKYRNFKKKHNESIIEVVHMACALYFSLLELLIKNRIKFKLLKYFSLVSQWTELANWIN